MPQSDIISVMNKYTSLQFFSAIILMLCMIFSLSGCSKKEEGIMTVGVVEATEVNLASKFPGRVKNECCEEGQNIAAGQTAFVIESDDIEASLRQAEAAASKSEAEKAEARARVNDAEAALKAAEADLAYAEADALALKAEATEAERDLKRIRALFEKGFSSQADLDLKASQSDVASSRLSAALAAIEARKASMVAAEAALKGAKSSLDAYSAGVSEKKADVDYQHAMLADAIINSPIDGVVLYRAVEPGEVVSAGTVVLTVANLKDLTVRVDVEESVVNLVKLGGKALVRFGDTSFDGVVTRVGSYASFATQRDVVRGRNDIKTFKVIISLGDTDGALKPGMTVDVEIPPGA